MVDGFVSRSVDEVQFWSRIMKEHSLFLKLGFRCEDTQLIVVYYFIHCPTLPLLAF
jgi:hypothetical protein